MGSGNNNNNYSGTDRRNREERRLDDDRRDTVRFEDVLGRRSGVERRVTASRPNP